MPVINGDDGDNLLTGGAEADTLNGLGGSDTLIGGAGADWIDGGPGVDLVSFRTATSGVTVLLGAGSGGDGDDQFTGIENVEGSGLDDLIIGDGFANLLRGSAGRDQLRGGAGGDSLEGGAGRDTLEGGEGADAFVFAAFDSHQDAADVITDWSVEDRLLFATAPGPLVIGFASNDLHAPIRANELLFGGGKVAAIQAPSGVFVFVMNRNGQYENGVLLAGRSLEDFSADNIGVVAAQPSPGPGAPLVLNGTSGSDELRGAEQGDTLNGLGGEDVLFGGPGGDRLDGGDGLDTASYAGGTAAVFVNLPTGQAVGQGTDTLSGIELVVGSSFGDTLVGTAGRETLGGGVGADSISGGGGRDLLRGEEGADTLTTGDEGGELDGGEGADVLSGGEAVDTLSGGDGDDVIRSSGGGADVVSGGAGADLFIFGPGDSVSGQADTISSWDLQDRIRFGDGSMPITYEEIVDTSFATAATTANARIASGAANVVVAQTQQGFIVFADSNNDNGAADTVVIAAFGSLDNVGAASFGGAAAASEPTLPGAPAAPSGGASGSMRGNMDLIQPGQLVGALVTDATDTGLTLQGARTSATLLGRNFAYANGTLVGGAGTGLIFSADRNGFLADLSVFNADFPAAQAPFWIGGNLAVEALSTILAGSDDLTGSMPELGPSTRSDLIRGFGGNDRIRSMGGNDTVYGGVGNDQIFAASGNASQDGSTYLRGDEGDDYVVGGAGFDDINGNMGADTASGGIGEDWVVGGKDNDLLFGDAAYDLVYGNLGADTCVGGEGDDIVRGGQDNDILYGSAGSDFVSGDKGDDTVTGGAGADSFHTFGDAGVDRVLDFSLAEGDRVQLDPETQYAVSQMGADTVISMTGGGQMILVGVAMSSLTGNWIFGA